MPSYNDNAFTRNGASSSPIHAQLFFFRNGVFPASASIDAHGRFIEKRNKDCSLQVSQATQELKASHRLRMT
jgi:hypothetical protein